jgi:hypothetical protein
MKVIANLFKIGLPIFIIFLFYNSFEFIFLFGRGAKKGKIVTLTEPIFYMVVPIFPKRFYAKRREN